MADETSKRQEAAVVQEERQLATQQITATLAVYVQVGHATGSAVVLDAQHSYLPVLIGSDQRPIPLYDFVEALDSIVDYSALQSEFPNLSFTQIAGAIAFLRKLAHFNTRGLDIDQLEDEALEQSAEFQEALRRAIADQGAARVLTPQ